MKCNFSKLDKKFYKNKKHFDNIAIKNLFDKKEINNILEEFPKIDDLIWWKYDNPFEKKMAFDDIQKMPPSIVKYFNFVNSRKFVKKLEDMTGIEGLISDPSLRAGGLHLIKSGGKLGVHADFKYHRVTGWKRKINLITYLNKDWEKEYGGSLQLWDKDVKYCFKEIFPFFNTTVIFQTDDNSYHGHPEPLDCPDNVFRRSLATYYYVLHDEDINNTRVKSTDYKKLPHEEYDEKIENLRFKRSMGRLKDETT